LFQDSKGFIWGGTAGGGVFSFNGIAFKNFNESDGLSGNIVTAINEDAEHNIWIASTWGGVSKYDGEKFEIFSTSNGLVGGGILDIKKTKNGELYFLSNKGISVLKNEKFTPFYHQLDSVNFTSISIYKNKLYVGSNNGLYIYDNEFKLQHHINKNNGLPENEIYSIIIDGKNDFIYLGTKKGIFKIYSGSIDDKKDYLIKQFTNNSTLNKSTVKNIYLDAISKNIWVATNNGLFKINKNEFVTYFAKNNGLPVNTLNCVFEDRAGNIWIGTVGSGLVKYSHQEYTFFDNWPGFGEPDIMAIDVVGDYVFIGNATGGIYKMNKNTYDEVEKIANLQTYAIKHKGDNVFFATLQGLYKYSNQNKTLQPVDTFLKAKSLLLDSNYIWVGTNGQGLYKLNLENNQVIETYNTTNSNLKHNFIHDLAKDDKNIWIGTGNGLHKLVKNKILAYPTSQLCNPYIGSISIDANKNVWFGTDRCVHEFDGVEFRSYTQKNGLNSNTVYFVYYDKRNKYLWVGTNQGLNRVSFNSYGQFSVVKHFNQYNGFKGIECNSRAITQDNNNVLWIGTLAGLTAFDLKELKENVFAPILQITDIQIHYDRNRIKKYIPDFNIRKNLPQSIELPYNENHITFSFIGINYQSPEAVKYSFYLENFDEKWCPETQQNSVTYSNLPPGIYVFHLKARNSDNVWSEPITVKLTITPPFWKTIWFYFIVVIAFMYFIYLISAIREQRQKKINEQLEAIVKERTKLIIQQRDEKEVLLKEIHHRVKNNLQIINSLLSIQSAYTKDQEALNLFDEAKNRIRAMALIHEKMYGANDLANINFNDYVQTLVKDLIDTYAINKNINLKINLPTIKFGIDTSIPLGLLLNEIISNSLKYAFNDTIENPEIIVELYFNSKNNEYLLKVGDNGIGMPREIFDKTDLPSLGMELIKIFVQQLDGTIELNNEQGTMYYIRFKTQ
jgi:two-component sensor histidine kinase/ligand-binding sensor domain-containing protein